MIADIARTRNELGRPFFRAHKKKSGRCKTASLFSPEDAFENRVHGHAADESRCLKWGPRMDRRHPASGTHLDRRPSGRPAQMC